MNAPATDRLLTAKEIRKRRRRTLGIRVGLGIGIPTLIAVVYYGALATPQFESSSSFTVQSPEGPAFGGVELLLGTVGGGGSGRDALLVQEYLQSPAILTLLTEKQGFAEHYGADSVDYLSRLSGEANLEERLKYLRDHITIKHDTSSGVLTLNVRAFSGEAAQQLNTTMLKAAESMVNEMMTKARTDRIALANREVAKMEDRLRKARHEILRLQEESGELSPIESATSLYATRTQFEGELAAAKAELSATRGALQPGAPEIEEAKRKVAAISAQLKDINDRLAGDDNGLHKSIIVFEPAMAEKEFAMMGLAAALKSLEAAQIDANRQHRYVVTISPPSNPDAATYPRVFIKVLTVLLMSAGILGVLALLIASVREHANL